MLRKILGNKKSEHFIKEGRVKGVFDEMLIHREIFNPNKFDLVVTRNNSMTQYILDAKIPLGPPMAVCKADSWLYLPHGYYFVKAANGADAGSFITNFGDAIGIGNRYPSLPIAESR